MLQAASNLNLPQPILIRLAKLQSIYFNLLLENYETIYLPVGMMVWQLFLLILLPIAIGMWLRHQIPGWVNKWAARFRQLTILALVLLILFITVVHANNLLFHIRELV